MKKLALLAMVVVLATGCVGAAHAGEKPALGTIRVSDGGTTNNAETGYLDGLAATGAFRLESNSFYSVQCDTAAYVSTDFRGTDAGVGVKLAADLFLTTNTQYGPVTIKPTVDGGTYTGGLIAISPAVGATSAVCRVFSRRGNE